MSAETIPADVLYLIRKGGLFYRPNSQGYTAHTFDAGRYTLAEAEAITHPNGPDGPRDGLSYVPAPADRSTRPAEPAASVAEGVRDTWFTDRALPVMAMSGDAESDRVLKLHFRRPVTDTDRQNLCDAMNLHQRSLNQVAEAGDGEVALKSLLAAIQLGHAACDADESSSDLSAFREAYGAHNAIEQLLANLRSTLEAERARADAAEQRAADALARAEKAEAEKKGAEDFAELCDVMADEDDVLAMREGLEDWEVFQHRYAERRLREAARRFRDLSQGGQHG